MISFLLIVFIFLFPVLLNFFASFNRKTYFSPLIFIGSIAGLAVTYLAFEQGSAIQLKLFSISNDFGQPLATIGFALDTLSGLIATVVLTIGAVVARFSVRYLEDDPNQKKFLRNLSFVLTSVIGVLLAENLIIFYLAWLASSFFLHQLLTHFKDRKGAIHAANQKFWISRLGDAFIISSSFILFSIFQSFDFQVIFKMVENQTQLVADHGFLLNMACLMIILGAMTKSAQFPFHFWLPNTMETPTPVSAIMHAGIINAGGYLIIRMSPMLNVFPHTLDVLAVVGGITTFYGAIVMITQTDVKKHLAYSTIAQMGFMMLQCGLGAFAVATLHIIGHAFYKAYAFLSSGTATDYGRLVRFFPSKPNSVGNNLWLSFFSAGISFVILFGISSLLGIELSSKPGALILTLILSLAMGQTLMSSTTQAQTLGYASAICLVYFLLYKGMSTILSGSVPILEAKFNTFDMVIFGIVSALFLVLYVVQNNLENLRKSEFGLKLYVKLYNGLYWGRR